MGDKLTHSQLPVELRREPLVEALFEIRVAKESASLVDVLPGILFEKLGKPPIARLAAADIPRPLRSQEPGLEFQPTIRLEWENYYVAIGDRNIVVSCKLPYPKWPNFKKAIANIIKIVKDVELPLLVERYSVKYVNLIEGGTHEEQLSKINVSIKLGPDKVTSDQVSLRVFLLEAGVIHITSIITGAEATLPSGARATGAIVDIDSIREFPPKPLSEIYKDFEVDLESLRQSNKVKFFGCLMSSTILELEPRYE